MSLSGPTGIDENLTFFVTGRYINDQGFLFGKRVFNISDNILTVRDAIGNQVRVDPGTVFTIRIMLQMDQVTFMK